MLLYFRASGCPPMSGIGGLNLDLTRNGILKALSAPDKALIAPRLEPVTLELGQLLFEPFEPIKHVHFFEGGLSSEVAVASKSLEIGCIGHEGCSGVPVILGVNKSPHRSFMQGRRPSPPNHSSGPSRFDDQKSDATIRFAPLRTRF